MMINPILWQVLWRLSFCWTRGQLWWRRRASGRRSRRQAARSTVIRPDSWACSRLMATRAKSTARICVWSPSCSWTIRRCTLTLSRFCSMCSRRMMSMGATWLGISARRSTACKSIMCPVLWSCHSISALAMAGLLSFYSTVKSRWIVQGVFTYFRHITSESYIWEQW